jgi:(2R)-ethylmalonyl-CoA mutase
VPLVRDVLERMKSEGAGDIPVVIGGIIPPEDAELLKGLGVAGVYPPRIFELNAIMSDIVGLVERGAV